MSTASGPEARPARRPRPLKLRLNGWLRWLHIYTSMVSLLVVLFFSLTGVTLNHPDWVFGSAEARREASGTLPADWKKGGEIDWLAVAEDLRAKHGLHGRAGDEHADDQEASIRFAAPGYSVDVFIDPRTGKYTLTEDAQGSLAVLNDLHRGRDSGGAWAWLIDLSGGFLALISLTGLGLLLYLKKVRVAALVTMGAGAVLVVVLMHLATT